MHFIPKHKTFIINYSKTVKILFFYFSLINPIQSNGAISFLNFSVENGLAQSQVQSILQDKNGFIWLGTKGGGLSKFDGHNFTTYTTDEGLCNNVINTSLLCKDGSLWFGTDNGISVLKNGVIKNYSNEDGLLDNTILSLYQDNNDRILIGTLKGLCYFKSGKFYPIKISKPNQEHSIKCILQDAQNTIWIGTRKGLFRLNNSNEERFTTENGLPSNNILSLKLDNNKNILIGTSLGIARFKNNKIDSTPFAITNLINVAINSIYIDHNFELWIGTSNGVINIKQDNSYEYYSRKNGLSHERILHVFEDFENNIWFCTDGSGIDYFCGKLFKGLTVLDGLPSNVIWSIGEDRKGSFWIGHDEGISCYKKGRFINYHNETSDPNYNPYVTPLEKLDKSKPLGKVFAVTLVDHNDFIWFGSEGGLSCFNHKSFLHFTTENGLPTNRIFAAFEDSKNQIWIGTSEGLVLIKDYKIERLYTVKDGLPHNRINAVTEDKKGRIWISTEHGLSVLKNKKFENFSMEHGLNNDFISNICFDKYDNVWLGTYGGGVSCFTNGVNMPLSIKNLHVFTKKEGLSDNECLFIIFNENGDLLAGTNKGLNKIHVNLFHNSKVKKIKNYGVREGYFGIESNMDAVYKDSKGRIWLGTIGGLIIYDQRFDVPNLIPPKISITNFQVLFTDTVLKNNTILDYKHNKITFKYCGISTSNPQKINYKFILEGYDKTWSPLTNEKFASYANLPAGKYTFKVKSRNNEGIWSETTANFTFSVTPPFWKTIWFYCICILFILFLFYLYLKWSQQKLQTENKILDIKIKARTKELNKKNIELEKLSIVVKETQNSVSIYNTDGEIEWVNQGYTKLFGYSLEESITELGPNLKSKYPNKDNEINECIISKSHLKFENETFTKSKQKKHIQSTLTPIYTRLGNLKKIIVIESDITELQNAKEEIEDINKDLVDSIRYAYRIQQAMLPSIEKIKNKNQDIFILFKPKDIVSGDFYWHHQPNPNTNDFLIAAVDCTGHGVPGAFMSVIANNLLKQTIQNTKSYAPSFILNQINNEIKTAVNQEENTKIDEVRDGMDMALLYFKPETKTVQYSGANRTLIHITKNELNNPLLESKNTFHENGFLLREYAANRTSIGGFTEIDFHFSQETIAYEKGDSFYIFSDGYTDQFGGQKNKKFMIKRLKSLLLSIQEEPMDKQEQILNETIMEWIGDLKQIDDILIIGIKMN